MRSKPTGVGAVSSARCSICGRPAVPEFRPFCSRRCADVDLSRWLGGVYAIPTTDSDADEDGDDAARPATPPDRRGD
ncbi:MAG: DNA gyrase inhibitor YacG [Hyphomicrobiaceae bacterium]|nr:DNA gyrase inhibitor YacG [Hyphomicrobiaceae bacterium]